MRALLLLALAATPAVADPLQDQLVAGMRATRTAEVAFTALTHAESTGSTAHDIASRYDGHGGWTLVSVDGHAPTAKQVRDAAKRRAPLPSYARLADWFGSPAQRIGGAGGEAIYRFAHLPAGTLKLGSHDASADAQAEASVATAGGHPYVTRVRFTSTASFRMMLVAKVERFAITSTYAPLPDGRVFPTGVETRFEGSMMGKAGAIATRTRYQVR